MNPQPERASLAPNLLERNARLLCEAQRVLAYGNLDSILQRPWAAPDSDPFPHFAARAQGCEIFDTLGRAYVDWVGGGGPVLLGYRHPAVERAIIEQLSCGPTLSLMHPLEVEVARELCAIVPCAERVAFGKNGSDGLTAALRVARARTGREHVLHYGMHGFHDWFVAGNPIVRGAPAGLAQRIHAFPYNDLAALEEHFERLRGQVAAVVMEPVREILPKPGYMQAVAELTHRNGALLVFDEVVTALRLGPGGGQGYVGVEPDLACLGKSLANGLPISALVGKRHAMELVPSVAFGMTFRGETLALAAAREVLRVLREEPVAEHLAEIGEELRTRYRAAAGRAGVRSLLAGPPARMTFTFEPQGGLDPAALQALFVQECLHAGVFTNGNILPSYAHDMAAVERSARAFERALDALAAATGARALRPEEGRTPPRAAIAIGFLESATHASGRLQVHGWMLLADGAPDALEARLPDGTSVAATPVERPDVAARHPGLARAALAGFRIEFALRAAPALEPCAFELRARRGDRVAFACGIVLEGEALDAPRWLGTGLVRA